MPFSGDENKQVKNITIGMYNMMPERWDTISVEAKNFVRSLLRVDPSTRLTAQEALAHPFITKKRKAQDVSMEPCCEALHKFSRTSRFRRCCMEMLAWSLPNEDRAKVRDCFLALDQSQQGTITLGELSHEMVDKLHLVDDHEVFKVFESLDYNHDCE